MQDVTWCGICLVSIGIMAACWWRDRRTLEATGRGANKLLLEMAKQAGRLECECRRMRLSNRRLQASLEDAGPMIIGDADGDGLRLEISAIGSQWYGIAIVHLRNPAEASMVTYERRYERRYELVNKLIATWIWNRGGVAICAARDIESVCELARSYNETFHSPKGVDSADPEQEAGRADRDPDRGTARADRGDGD